MNDRPFFVQSDAIGSAPIEMFSLEKQRDRLIVANDFDLKDAVKGILDNWRHLLPIAAEVMNISPSVKDYVLVPTISMPSDLPNRNGQGFPYTELTGWCVDAGMVMYKTWIGMPTFQEHENKDPTRAKGIILDCMMRAIPQSHGNIWKVVKLLGFDRLRDPVLANDILTRRRTSYSMGAHARDFACSVCGTLKTQGGCGHVHGEGTPIMRKFGRRIGYNNIIDPKGFECSSVASPAYYSAKDMPFMSWI